MQRELQRLEQLIARRGAFAAPPVVQQQRSRGAGRAAGRAQPRALCSALSRQGLPGASLEPEVKLSSSRHQADEPTRQARSIHIQKRFVRAYIEARSTSEYEAGALM